MTDDNQNDQPVQDAAEAQAILLDQYARLTHAYIDGMAQIAADAGQDLHIGDLALCLLSVAAGGAAHGPLMSREAWASVYDQVVYELAEVGRQAAQAAQAEAQAGAAEDDAISRAKRTLGNTP